MKKANFISNTLVQFFISTKLINIADNGIHAANKLQKVETPIKR